jgi:outer membrane protein
MKIAKLSALQMIALLSTAGFTSLTGVTTAVADEPANDIRLGLYSVFYHSSADDITGPYVPAGVNLTAENLETLYVGVVHHFPDNFALELALGYPPLSKVKGTGPATLGSTPYDGQVISSARWISPTLLVEYNFLPVTAMLRPYIGVGVNYTTFYDRDSTAAGNAASGGPTRISLTSSVGPAVTGGVTYRISDHWAMHASYGWSQVRTRFTGDTDGFVRSTHISFGPQALIISGGYSF